MEDLYINIGTELGNESYIGTESEWIAHLVQNTEWYSAYVSYIRDGNEERRLEAETFGELDYDIVDVPSIEEWAKDQFKDNCVEWDGIEEAERL